MIKIEKDLLIEDIKNRLASFGYTLLDTDNFALDFVIDKVENKKKSICIFYRCSSFYTCIIFFSGKYRYIRSLIEER